MRAADTEDDVKAAATDLGVNTTTTYNAVVGNTSDVTFAKATTYTNAGTLTLGANLSPGSLDDLNATAIVIGGTGQFTLNAGTGSSNVVSSAGTNGGSGLDVLFVATGANLTLNNTGGILLTTKASSFDAVGTGVLNIGSATGVTIIAGQTLTFSGSGTINVGGAIAATTGAVTINDAGGSTTFSGANLYTGATTVTAGTFNLSGSLGATAITVNGGTFNETGAGVIGSTATLTTTGGATKLSGLNTYSGATSVNGGTLTLDFSAATTPASATNIIKTGNTVNLGGGTLAVKGGGTGTNSQTFGTTALTANEGSAIVANLNGGTALNLALGGITRNAQSAVDITFGGANITTSTAQAPLNGILVNSSNVAYATANGGTSFVAKATGTSPFALSALPDASYATTAANYTTNNNVDVTTGDSVTGVTVNTLRFNAANDALTLSGTNVVNTGGVLVTPTGTGSTISGGTLTAGTGGHELVLHDYGSLNVSSTIADNGTATALTIAGTGLTTLSGANTLTGTTSIVGTGGLRLGNANALQNSTLAFSPNTATSGLSFASGIGTFTVGGLTGSTSTSNLLTLTDTAGAGVNLQVGNGNVTSTFQSGINGLGTLTKIGTGTLNVAEPANLAGNITVPIVVNAGTVFSTGVTSLQNVPSITINNGGVVAYGRGSVLIASGAATDTVTVNSGGIISSDYIASSGAADTAIGALVLNGGTVATRNQPATGAAFYDRGTFGLGTASGTVAGSAAVTAGGGTNPTSTISAVNVALRETGGTVFNVMAGSGTGGSASATGGVDLLFSGTILTRSFSANTTLIKQGNGVMELTGANTFTTPVQINAGILQVNSIADGGVQTTGTAASGSSSITVTNATGIAAGQAVGGTGINAGSTVGNGYTAGSTTVPLVIPSNATLTGTTGAVSGTITFGTANPLGISAPVASNLIIDGGTLQYVGGTGSTNRLFQVGAATAGSTSTIDSSGTGALNFTNTGALTYGTAAQTRNLVLTGTNTNANTLAPSIADNTTGVVSLSKTGVGSWTLTGNNTYTGTTTVSGGTLTATGTGTNKALGGTTGIAVNNGGTLVFGASNQASSAAAIMLGTNAAQTPASTTGILSFAAGANQGTAGTLTGGTAGGSTAAGLGALTLNNTATLAFGGTGTTLVFGAFIPNSNVLNITGYTNMGAMTAGNSGTASDDRLVFFGDQTANFNDFNFNNMGAGVNVGEIALDNGFYEVTITPVPEPSTWMAGIASLGVLGIRWLSARRKSRREAQVAA